MVWLINVLIAFIIILIALAIFAGAFYMARHHTRLEARNVLLEENYKLAEEHIKNQEEKISWLTNESDYLRMDLEKAGMRVSRSSSWNPSDPLNMGERQ